MNMTSIGDISAPKNQLLGRLPPSEDRRMSSTTKKKEPGGDDVGGEILIDVSNGGSSLDKRKIYEGSILEDGVPPSSKRCKSKVRSEGQKRRRRWHRKRNNRGGEAKGAASRNRDSNNSSVMVVEAVVTGSREDVVSTASRPKHLRRETWTNNAPFNSTQFLMNDHAEGDEDTIQYLDAKLGVRVGDGSAASSIREPTKCKRVTRARESSFCLNSDEDDFCYSSPEDEEEFVSREFIKEYNNCRNDRLIGMSKTELIQEFLSMESKVDALENKLRIKAGRQKLIGGDKDAVGENGDQNMKAEDIPNLRREIERLERENEQLRMLSIERRRRRRPSSPDHNDSSSSSSNSSTSSSSSSEQGDLSDIADRSTAVADVTVRQNVAGDVRANEKEDTGYESGQSGSRQRRDVQMPDDSSHKRRRSMNTRETDCFFENSSPKWTTEEKSDNLVSSTSP